MDNLLKLKMMQRISAGLRRASLTTCSKWAQECVVMGQPYPGPLNFRHHPWQLGMHDSEAPVNIGQKSAQMGYTVAAMNRCLFEIDVNKRNCAYYLPTKTPDATDFSADRFGKLLDNSPHLEKMFSSVSNVGIKRAGSASLYIRGMNSRSGLKSIDVAFLVFDEVDEMDPDKVELAESRQDGQLSSTKRIWKISTPTVPEWGINKAMGESTNEHFFFDCPHCSKVVELFWDKDEKRSCLVICGDGITDPDIKKSYIRCPECHHELEHGEDGIAKEQWLNDGRPRWVPTNRGANQDVRGFYINQLYSCTVSPAELARKFFLAQVDPAAETEFFNSKLGLPHVVDGARVDDEMLANAMRRGGYHSLAVPPQGALITMGVDVGKWLHYVVCQWFFPEMGNDLNVMAHCRVLVAGKCREFREIDQLLHTFQPRMTVIDSEPEDRASIDLTNRFPGYVKRHKFTKGHAGKMINVSSDPANHYVTCDRTSWIDLAMGRYKTGRIDLPLDTDWEFSQNIKALVKRYELDKNGNPTSKYINTGADHFALAQTYAEIALPLAASLLTNRDIGKFM